MPRKETKPTAKASPRRKKTNVVTESTFTRESTGTQIQKPVIGIGTWIALVLFAGLVTFAIFLNKKEETAVEATPTSGTVPLFPATEGTPSSIEVKPAEGEAVRVLRNEENVWVLELPFDDALAMVADGRIRDAKTIMLLQHAALQLFAAPVHE